MVHDKGLEPLHLAAQPPEDCVSTNSTSHARSYICCVSQISTYAGYYILLYRLCNLFNDVFILFGRFLFSYQLLL